ncbi:MAG: hypothetical protein H7A51_09700 [Akkermansiaceae bacterium]|nr:hypothetical protein [Akkermansiaceae bacterium]
MIRIFIVLSLTTFLSHAGVYGDLEFGDSRETVTRKMSASQLVEQTIDSTFFGRTGLNGVFKCKAKLAGLSYHLYFGWNEDGGLNEVTLRSSELSMEEYGRGLRRAWGEAEALFSQVYQKPSQKADYPDQKAFTKHNILISHVWHRGENQSILMGPGIDKGKCFLAIRYVNQRIVLPSLPKKPSNPKKNR